jgi:hypothetical protein
MIHDHFLGLKTFFSLLISYFQIRVVVGHQRWLQSFFLKRKFSAKNILETNPRPTVTTVEL